MLQSFSDLSLQLNLHAKPKVDKCDRTEINQQLTPQTLLLQTGRKSLKTWLFCSYEQLKAVALTAGGARQGSLKLLIHHHHVCLVICINTSVFSPHT